MYCAGCELRLRVADFDNRLCEGANRRLKQSTSGKAKVILNHPLFPLKFFPQISQITADFLVLLLLTSCPLCESSNWDLVLVIWDFFPDY